MSNIVIPKDYKGVLTSYETQTAIGKTKRIFEDYLAKELNLKRVSAPLFVEGNTGLNDDLNGIERAVEFDVPETGSTVQVVHSLAKWKRMALHKYCFSLYEGLYTDMNAIRRDETMDNLHSIYVDQWDWEVIIDKNDRNLDFLKETVRKIVYAICSTEHDLSLLYPVLKPTIKQEVFFITTEELLQKFPNMTAKERENAITREQKTVFLMQIGGKLSNGHRHDGRAPDYDDWSLNGDLLFWDDVLDMAVEISSMGVRVDAAALDSQLTKANCNKRRELPFHKMLLEGRLPQTVGGGIGQSRLCMLLLKKAHVGEVQVSVWDGDTIEQCEKLGIELL